MTQYFEMKPNHYLDFGVTKYPLLGAQSILGGRIIEKNILPQLVYEVDFPDDTDLPHFLTGGIVLASGRLIELLRSQGVDNFQAFPVEVLNPETGKKRQGYYLFNVIGLLAVVDLNKSAYDELMPASPHGSHVPLAAFSEIVIDSKRTMGMLMFRLAENPTVLLIHEKIVDALSENRPENGWGIMVVEVESV